MRRSSFINGLLILAGFSGILGGCDQKPPPGKNQVTINPVIGTPTDKQVPLGVDKSPMDMSYFPVDYPKLKMSKDNQPPLIARVIYSRPQKSGRAIFGDVLKYGSVWRLGANEATEIEFFKDVVIDQQKVEKGRYVLYCIPYEDKWTLVLNNDLFTWGLKIDSTKDAYKFNIPINRTNYPFEVFTMEFEKQGEGAELVMEWDSVRAKLPFTY
ncbi:DUF2911 domain-containing protein [Paraflavitalea sp. CAU 1676]|uniref:DUF2911 domain-containing protein n=1 Tax=Paraflavitalea sp. CAU 1676 TaxID=3032598 RepID=UPI0023DAD139|nr:DUF2911 domain-containing protein [Paraflavitalea sp. CAU 1676]MDF2190788.1 DUF2911 domain-containing protein [Paraflavitalea sp. CAU 1676]